jgi:hypothetical protein
MAGARAGLGAVLAAWLVASAAAGAVDPGDITTCSSTSAPRRAPRPAPRTAALRPWDCLAPARAHACMGRH